LKHLFITLLIINCLLAPQLSAQEENQSACPEITNKKAIEYLEKGRNKKKYEFKERMEYVKKALEEEPDFAEAQYEMAALQITLAVGNGTGFKPAEKYLLRAIELCPDINPYAYYYLGQIAWGGEDYAKTVSYFEKFTKNPENAKKPEDFDKAAALLRQAKFYEQIYKNKVEFDPKPIKNIDTFEDEFLPMLSPDNEFLYYTKRYMKQGKDVLFPQQVEELTEAQRSNDEFVKPHAMDMPFNTPGENYGGITFSLDNKHLFITVCKANKKGYVNCDIYTSDLNREEEWGPLKNLGPNVNTEDGWEAQPSLSSDGKTLIFAGARADGKGMDLYKTQRENTNAEWQPAVNMGPQINTDKNEKSPFIHSDSQTLYFTSDGWPGVGGYDIFFAKMNDDGKWTIPKNIGIPINTEKDEVGFFVSTDGLLGYISSKDLKGKGAGGWDIFSFPLYKEARPEKILFIKGELRDETGALMSNTKIEIETMSSKKKTMLDVDSVTGKYTTVVTLKGDEDAILTVKRPDYGFYSTYIKAGDTTIGKPIKINMDVKPIEKGATFNIKDINYKSNSADLTEESKRVLQKFAEYLNETKDLSIEIRGHTDNVGNPKSNLALSTDRAFTVMDFLLQHGIPKSRVSFKGFGDTKPIADNSTETGRAKNRRTEFVILGK
jgi:outer membrane protein OmpA-like peptidoglycan-associated protein